MSDNEMLYCLVAFILGWLVSRQMGDGFSVGGLDDENNVHVVFRNVYKNFSKRAQKELEKDIDSCINSCNSARKDKTCTKPEGYIGHDGLSHQSVTKCRYPFVCSNRVCIDNGGTPAKHPELIEACDTYCDNVEQD